MGFDWILSSQRDAAEDDEDEDEVSEVGMVDEAVAGDAQAEDEREKRQREREEVLFEWNPRQRAPRSARRPPLPVFLSQDKEGASVRDGDNLLFRPGKVRL